ncbi:MAG: deoxynucleoside kinase [Bdellovibrionaceae bacterium]|nr:deoxynucleoside kinase [Pseudobdellovibrionaceae bacterium]
MKMIIVEGNIGAGKTTLTKNLAKIINAKLFLEPVETNPYLQKYYDDPKTYALPMQFFLMSTRYDMHRQGIEHTWRTGQTCIFDRSIFGDYVFAKKNWLDGNMSDLDFHNYNQMRRVMFKTLMTPHLTIFLKNDPKVTYKNIVSRSRDCENKIPLEYLQGLHDLYQELIVEMQKIGSVVIEIDWNEFKPLDYVLDQIKEHLPSLESMSIYPQIVKNNKDFMFKMPEHFASL